MNKILVETVSSILNIAPTSVTDETSHDNTPSWDSLAHLRLILELEQNLGVRFRSQDIPELMSVASLNKKLLELKA